MSIGTGAVAAGAVAGTHTSTAAAPKLGPSGLRFYTPSRLPAGPHGTLIWERPFHGVAALKGATNYLVLYKQVGVRGQIVPVSGHRLGPQGQGPQARLAGGHLRPRHDRDRRPVRAARDTGAASGADGADIGIAPLLNTWIKAGYAVVRTDYEGLGTPGPHPYLIGHSEGYGVLDIVLAARQLDPALSNRDRSSPATRRVARPRCGRHRWRRSTPRRCKLLGTLAFAPAVPHRRRGQLPQDDDHGWRSRRWRR